MNSRVGRPRPPESGLGQRDGLRGKTAAFVNEPTPSGMGEGTVVLDMDGCMQQRELLRQELLAVYEKIGSAVRILREQPHSNCPWCSHAAIVLANDGGADA
jgi:hypothetical protein